MALPPKYDEEYRTRLKQFELENAPKHGPQLYGIFFAVGSMMLISVTLSLNNIENEFMTIVGGVLIGGSAYLIQNQKEKDYSKKYIQQMNDIETELLNRLKYEENIDDNNTSPNIEKSVKQTNDIEKNVNKEGQSEHDYDEFILRVKRNLNIFFNIDVDNKFKEKENYWEFEVFMDDIAQQNISSLLGTIITIIYIHNNSDTLYKCFEFEERILHYEKIKILLKEFNINPKKVPYKEPYTKNDCGDFIRYINEEIENIKETLKSDGKQKYKSENILTDIFYYHRILISCIKRAIKESKGISEPKKYIELAFEKLEFLNKLFIQLEKDTNEDYVYNIKELLLLEESFSKVSQQKILEEIKLAKYEKKLSDHNLIKEIILKDYDKLKI